MGTNATRFASLETGITEDFQSVYTLFQAQTSEFHKTPFYETLVFENLGDATLRIAVLYTAGKTPADIDSRAIQPGAYIVLYNVALTNIYIRTEDQGETNIVEVSAVSPRFSSKIYG